VAGKADLLPATIRTIAIPAFGNNTTRYKLTERLPSAITREFLTRTRYRVITDVNQADAILTGTVLNVVNSPTIFDTTSGRAAGLMIAVYLNVRLVERATGNVLFTRPMMEIRERYEVSIEQTAYFDESEAALDRLSHQVARSIVAQVLEAF
jgi:hypothetical protein